MTKLRHVLIEMDRGNGWERRQEGDAKVTVEQVRNLLPAYAISYPHRAFVDGKLVGSAEPPDPPPAGGIQ
jgi:hypothetical protein